VTLGAFRYGGGFLALLPVSLALRGPGRADATGSASSASASSSSPLSGALQHRALVDDGGSRRPCPLDPAAPHDAGGAMLGIEKLTARKTLGVGIATAGVAAALGAGLGGARRGLARRYRHGRRRLLHGAL